MFRHNLVPLTLLAALLAMPVLAERTRLKPDFNIFTIAQDVELGRRIARDMEGSMQILGDPMAIKYLDRLGTRLAAKAPGGRQFRLQFKIVNDKTINAVGLPGGFLYLNRGAIEAADNEAHLASIIAHELGHVVLRHGTHQISKAYALQAPVSSLGGIGRMSVSAVLAKIGGGFTANSIVLKNPLEAERQADLMGVQIIYDAGYDPRAAAQVFGKVALERKGAALSAADHPDLADRIDGVNKEIDNLGGAPPAATQDAPEFRVIKQSISAYPAPAN